MGLRFAASIFFFQAEDGIRDLVRSRGLGDVYKRQMAYRVEDRQLSSFTDEELMFLVQSEDRSAFGVLMRRYESALSLIHI